MILGLSGGGDSLALAARLAPGSTLCVVVDHGLRPGSAADAARAADIARALGHAAVVRRWAAPRPSQAAARAARLSILCEEARDVGASRILLAHTADDQAETVAWRLLRGSDVWGLAGLRPRAPAPLWPAGDGLIVERPLLDDTRAGLRAELTGRGLSWIDDPANEDGRYARVRVRRRLAALLAGRAGLCALAARTRALRERVEARARLAAAGAAWDGPQVGWAWEALAFAGAEAGLLALRALIAAVGGGAGMPDAAAAGRLVARLVAGGGGATLAGALVARRGGVITLRPAPPRRGQARATPHAPQRRVAALLHDLDAT